MTKTIPIIPAVDKAPEGMSTSIEGDGMGCHAGGEKMLAAAKASGKSEVLAPVSYTHLTLPTNREV